MTIGTGHVVRCLTLARELRDRGWSVALAGRMPDALADEARAAGVEIRLLPETLPAEAEPAHLAAEAALDADLVVVDHYGLGTAWQRAVRKAGQGGHGPTPIMAAITDLTRDPQDVDLLVDQNLGATPERCRHLVTAQAVVLTGPRYALLRPEFAAEREALTGRDGSLRRLVVFLSGADEHDVTRRAAQAAVRAGVKVDVVVGSAYQRLAALRDWAAPQPGLELHVGTPHMARLMAAADLAIGAPSSASWERCAVGLPAILVILADNQVEIGRRLEQLGAAVTLGWHHQVGEEAISEAIRKLASDPARMQAMGRSAAEITDGRGARRVADAIGELVDRRGGPGAGT